MHGSQSPTGSASDMIGHWAWWLLLFTNDLWTKGLAVSLHFMQLHKIYHSNWNLNHIILSEEWGYICIFISGFNIMSHFPNFFFPFTCNPVFGNEQEGSFCVCVCVFCFFFQSVILYTYKDPMQVLYPFFCDNSLSMSV